MTYDITSAMEGKCMKLYLKGPNYFFFFFCMFNLIEIYAYKEDMKHSQRIKMSIAKLTWAFLEYESHFSY